MRCLNHPDTRAKKTSPRQNKAPQLIEIRAGGDFSSVLKLPYDYGQDDRSAMRRTASADIANLVLSARFAWKRDGQKNSWMTWPAMPTWRISTWSGHAEKGTHIGLGSAKNPACLRRSARTAGRPDDRPNMPALLRPDGTGLHG